LPQGSNGIAAPLSLHRAAAMLHMLPLMLLLPLYYLPTIP
jgi:hypothetical protein